MSEIKCDVDEKTSPVVDGDIGGVRIVRFAPSWFGLVGKFVSKGACGLSPLHTLSCAQCML
jgi:hypothetical protein